MSNIFKLLKPHSVKLFFALVAVLVQIWSILTIPNLLADIVNNGIAKNDIDYILKIGVSMLVISLLGSVATFINGYIASIVSASVSRDLRNNVFSKATKISIQNFEKIGASSLITRTTNDITQVQTFIVMLLRVVLIAPFLLVGALAMAIHKNTTMSLVILLAIPFLVLTIGFIAKKGFFLFENVQRKVDSINLICREKLIGMRVIRVFNKDKYEEERFDDNNKELTDLSTRVNRIVMLAQPALVLILNMTVIAVIYVGAYQINSNLLSVGDLMAFVQYIMQILMSVMMFAMMFVIFPKTFVSINRVYEVLNTENEEDNGDINLQVKNGLIEFKNVNFRFPGADKNALSNISFIAKPNETTAIIGSTGSGKSTISKLLVGIYDINSGEILIDNKNIENYTKYNIRKSISYVAQKALLFSGTILDTVTFANENANDEEIENALKDSSSFDFVMNKDDGLNSNVAQGGTNFSGGQKQRLSIARALAKTSNIYIFDDSFSALDYKTDLKVRKALKEITENKTVIIIAQRVSTVMNANNIIVVDEGQIVSQGTHAYLLDSCEVYKEIVHSQDTQEVQ